MFYSIIFDSNRVTVMYNVNIRTYQGYNVNIPYKPFQTIQKA